MSVMSGGAKAAIYKGNYKPVNFYKGGIKAAGWKLDSKTGVSLEWSDTYFDAFTAANIQGASTQSADYGIRDGSSAQVITTQGKNLFDKSKATLEKYVNWNDGNLGSNISYFSSDWIRVTPNTNYIGGVHLAFYDVNKVFISGISNSVTYYTTPANCYYLRVCSTTSISLFQVELGIVSTAYAPFVPNSPSTDYPSPITVGQGKNLFNGLLELGYWDISTGVKIAGTNQIRCQSHVAVLPSTQYTISGWVGGTDTWIVFYDATKTYLNKAYGNTFTTPAGTYYITFYRIGTVTIPTQFQLELDSIATAYESYQYRVAGTYKHTLPNGDIYEFTLPDDIRSVGTVKDRVCFDNLSKKGWINKNIEKLIVNGTESNWVVYTPGCTLTFTTVYCAFNLPMLGFNTSICSHFKNFSAGWDAPTYEHCSDHATVTNKYFMFANTTLGVLSTDDTATRLNKAKAWMVTQNAAVTPMTVVYQRATTIRTPITFTKVVSSTVPEFPLDTLTVTTPTPDYPMSIINTGDSVGVTVATRGKNLTAIPSLHLSVSNGCYKNYFPNSPAIPLKPSTTYTLAFDYIINSASAEVGCGIGYGVSSYTKDIIYVDKYPIQTSGRYVKTFTTPASFIENPPNLQLRLARMDVIGNLDVNISNVIIALGSFTSLPYQPYYTPYSATRNVVLYSVPDGTHDDYDVLTGTVTRRVKRIVFDGDTAKVSPTSNYYYYTVGVITGSKVYCTHCVSQMNYGSLFPTVFVDGGQMYFPDWTPLFPTSAAINAWFAAQYAAGTPFTVLYKLPTPVTEYVDPVPLPTFPHYTRLECSAAITASARVVDKTI